VLGMGWLPTSLPPTLERLAVVGEPTAAKLVQAYAGLQVGRHSGLSGDGGQCWHGSRKGNAGPCFWQHGVVQVQQIGVVRGWPAMEQVGMQEASLTQPCTAACDHALPCWAPAKLMSPTPAPVPLLCCRHCCLSCPTCSSCESLLGKHLCLRKWQRCCHAAAPSAQPACPVRALPLTAGAGVCTKLHRWCWTGARRFSQRQASICRLSRRGLKVSLSGRLAGLSSAEVSTCPRCL